MEDDNNNNDIPSLASLCSRKLDEIIQKDKSNNSLMQNFFTCKEILSVYECDDDSPLSIIKRMYFYLLESIKSRFPFMLEKYGEARLKEILPESDFRSCLTAFQAEQAVKKRVSTLKGTILDPTEVYIDEKYKSSGFYPVEALVQGVKWPSDVDATKREQYLNPEDFVTIFGMSKESFNALPKIKRIELRKLHKLF